MCESSETLVLVSLNDVKDLGGEVASEILHVVQADNLTSLFALVVAGRWLVSVAQTCTVGADAAMTIPATHPCATFCEHGQTSAVT
jgi:hypothetical protein